MANEKKINQMILGLLSPESLIGIGHIGIQLQHLKECEIGKL
ncbi:hypothetical protein AB8U03_07705 [Clostridium sp. Mt-5]|uniref:Uncharacterized protein n=1 Tax=Clostridium moutaii TaxID=3240932 RepID=A0ABV4BMS9_9CLOT